MFCSADTDISIFYESLCQCICVPLNFSFLCHCVLLMAYIGKCLSLPFLEPAGGILSSGNDMGKWMLFLLNNATDKTGKEVIRTSDFQEALKVTFTVSESQYYWFSSEKDNRVLFLVCCWVQCTMKIKQLYLNCMAYLTMKIQVRVILSCPHATWISSPSYICLLVCQPVALVYWIQFQQSLTSLDTFLRKFLIPWKLHVPIVNLVRYHQTSLVQLLYITEQELCFVYGFLQKKETGKKVPVLQYFSYFVITDIK